MENNNVAENSGTQMVTPEPTYMLIAMDNAVAFPGHLTSLSVGKQSADALVNAAAVGGEVFFVYSPSVGDNGMPANRVGTLSRIKQVIRNSRGGLSLIVSGRRRMEVKDVILDRPVPRVTLSEYEEKQDDEVLMIAIRGALVSALKRSTELSPKLFDTQPTLDDPDDFIGEMASVYYDNN